MIEGFTMVAKSIFKKRTEYSARSFSHNNKIKEVITSYQNKTLDDIVAKGNTEYIFKNL